MNEGALVFASLIVGIAVTDQLSSLHRLLRVRPEVRWAILPLWTALLIFLTQVQVWWSIAGEKAARLTIAEFLPTLAVLTFLFLAAAASLPDKVEGEGERDLGAFYQREGRHIWVMFALALGWALLPPLVGELARGARVGPLLSTRATDLLVLVMMASNAVIRDRRWHFLTLAVLSTGPIGWLSRSLG